MVLDTRRGVIPSPSAPRWSDEFLDYYRRVGDTEADAAVAEILRHPDWNAATFFRWLVRNDSPLPEDVPPSVARFYTDTGLPPWADPALIEEGERVFRAWGPQISLALVCSSLPTGYSAPRIVRILDATARLETDALRRVFETAQLLFDVLDAGGLRPGGKGIRSAQRVRLMHAAVRHLIARQDQSIAEEARIANREPDLLWPTAWGKPINQEDLAGTLLTFTTVVLDGIGKLGVRLTPRQREAYLHLGRVMGHYMGILDEMLPLDEGDARALWAAQERRQLYHRTDAGDRMTAALLGAIGQLIPGRRFDFVSRGMVRYLGGGRAADAVGVRRLRGGGHALFVTVMRFERMFAREESTHSRAFSLTSRYQRALLNGLVNHRPANFQLPDHLQGRWGITAPSPPTAATIPAASVATTLEQPGEDRTPVARP